MSSLRFRVITVEPGNKAQGRKCPRAKGETEVVLWDESSFRISEREQNV